MAGLALAHPGHAGAYAGGRPGASTPNGWIASGVVVYSHIPLSAFPGPPSTGNDCWGYTSPSGREYALMGLSNGISVVEVTNPLAPVQLAHFPHPSSSVWADVKVIDDWAYGVTEAGGGIRVMDLRLIDQGIVTSPGFIGSGPSHNIVSNPETGYVFRVGGATGCNTTGLRWYNARANPAAPVFEGEFQDYYVHDAQVVIWNRPGPYLGHELAFMFCGDTCGNGSSNPRLRVVDVTNKAAPVLICTYQYASPAYSHQGWLTEDQHYLYLDDELDEQTFGWTTRTRIIDVSNPAAPIQVGEFSSGVNAIDHNQYTHDGYVYQANYRSGMRVFDYASNPLSPTQVAWLDTYPADDAAQFDGTWSTFPYFESGTVLMSDIQQGLIVCKVFPNRLEFSYPLGAPDIFDPAGGTQLTVEIAEIRATLDASTVRMVLSDGISSTQITGVPTGQPGRFVFTTPRLDCSATPTYYIQARTTTNDVFTDPPLATQVLAERFSATVASGSADIFSDNFETNMGWTVSNSGSLTDGAWDRGVPANGGRGDPGADADGSGQCYLTHNLAGNSDIDGGSTTLTSPTMDASQGETYIEYWRWFNNSFGSAPFEDTLVVEVSNNNGSTWSVLEVVGPDGPEVSGGWFRKSFRVRDTFATPSDQFRVRFTASDLAGGSVVEGAIDGVELVALTCDDACAADLSGSSDPNDPAYGVPDGQADSADFFYYLDQFVAQNLAVADLTGSSDPNDPAYGTPDGMIDAADFFYYLDLFVQGC
ncbi:MAG: choice-of-anchor B family protein [Phycisphaerales bacterium]|nr:choice-of-anchor B family protein [Phycisphaerales bacterium]